MCVTGEMNEDGHRSSSDVHKHVCEQNLYKAFNCLNSLSSKSSLD